MFESMGDWIGKMGNFWLSLLVVTSYGLLMGAIIDRTIAKVQGRIGMPYWQPFINVIKTFFKRTAISHGVMFYLGPVFRIAGGIGTLAFIPVITVVKPSLISVWLAIYFWLFTLCSLANWVWRLVQVKVVTLMLQ